mgnify:CR=1 FL=1
MLSWAKANYLRRLLGTAIAFSTFGLGGAALGLVFPLLNGVTPTQQRQPLARRTIHAAFIFFLRWMRALGIMEWQVEGIERLGRPGQLVIANHPSLLYVVFIIAHIEQANCVVKGALLRNPFTRGPVRAAGFIANEVSETMLEQGAASLAQGDCLIMFPEGTRTKPEQAIAFHRGAAALALKAARHLTPVIIDVSPTTLTKNEKWYSIPPRKFKMTLRVADDIDLTPYRSKGSAPIAARRLNADLTAFYTRECHRG